MIQFSLDKVLSDWQTVTVHRSPDDIEYHVTVDSNRYRGRYTRLDELIAILECCIARTPTADHPRSTTYDIREINEHTEIEIENEWYRTSYEELESSLRTFLQDLFTALDQKSTTDEKERAVEYLRNIETLVPFQNLCGDFL